MHRSWKPFAVLAVTAALFVAGCGDDDDETSSATTTSTPSGATGVTGAAATKEQWIATADEVCANADDEVQAALEQQGISESSSPEELGAFSESIVLPIQQSVLNTLRGLTPPEDEEEAVNEILDAFENGLVAVEASPELLQDPGQAEVEFDEADQLATDYGLKVCGD